MKLDIAIELFEGLKTKTEKKSEIKMYTKFQKLLISIKEKGLEENQLIAIEEKLESFELNSDQTRSRRYYRKKYNALVYFIQKEFSYVTEGYYTGLFMALGMSFGLAIGTAFGMPNGLVFGMIVGMMLGLFLGRYKDEEAKKQNKILK